MERAVPRFIATFGRRRGHKLRKNRQALFDTLLPDLQLSLPEQGELPLARIFPEAHEVWFEVGFGGGEHLAQQAEWNPNVGIIGCEPYINGVGGLLARIQSQHIRNIRIFNDDARLVAERLPDASISRVFILYPDPWPKARHHKRRLVSKPFLDELARVMKPGGQLRLATDDAPYCTWMLEQTLPHPAFLWQAGACDDWLNPPKDWISTRYEQKALAVGRTPTYLQFIRR